MKPLFSICLIAKNEEKTLPRFINSPTLKEFQSIGGEVCLLDTGSTDNTVQIAKNAGFVVKEVGTKHIHWLTTDQCKEINKMFVVEEDPILPLNDKHKYFHFSDARNEAASLASNDIVSFADCDEVFTSLNIGELNRLIQDGYEQFEYQFVYAHDAYGNAAIQFVQSKMYDRRKVKWNNIIHEYLTGNAKKILLAPNLFKLEHYQISSDHRTNYLPGLAIDCWMHLDYDRNSHYFARELMWNGRPKSAIKEFDRHIAMNGWPSERAQSWIFKGDCYLQLNKPDEAVTCYNKAIMIDNGRREAFIKLARFYKMNNRPTMVAAYAMAAMEIPWADYYANDQAFYTFEPHSLLYWAKGWTGDIKSAQEHILKALDYQRANPDFLRDTKFYFEYPEPPIPGWMSFRELQFLYNNAKKFNTIIEVGSWKGRSTHALLSGCKGKVVAVDHWLGSKDEPDAHAQAKDGSVFKEFKENIKQFTNLKICECDSLNAAPQFQDNSADMVFIDAGHTYEEVKADIKAWRGKARFLLCGHDYDEKIWPGVKRAVDEEVGTIDGVEGTIWYKFMNMPKVSIVIPSMRKGEKLQRCLNAIKNNANYDNKEVIVEYDYMENRQGAPKTFQKGVEKSRGELVMFLGDDCIPKPNFLINAVRAMYLAFGKDMDGLVAMNDGYWQGDIATHWLASKKLLPAIGGEFFHTGYTHTGCDNELSGRTKKLNKFVYAEDAELFHDHPLNTGWKNVDEVIKVAYAPENLKKDKELLYKRAEEFGFEVEDCSYRPLEKGPIPKKIFTIWLNDKPKEMPNVVFKSIVSQSDVKGYEHKLITLDNCWKGSPYVIDCINNKAWVKAADFLRAYYLYTEGGIYLDADTEVLPNKNFDQLLDNKMFCCKEDNGFIANGIVGSVKDHPLLGDFLNYVEQHFKGDDGKVFEAGMEVFTNMVYSAKPKWGIKVYPMEYFLPFNHQTGITNITDNTITFHHYLKSWKVEK